MILGTWHFLWECELQHVCILYIYIIYIYMSLLGRLGREQTDSLLTCSVFWIFAGELLPQCPSDSGRLLPPAQPPEFSDEIGSAFAVPWWKLLKSVTAFKKFAVLLNARKPMRDGAREMAT